MCVCIIATVCIILFVLLLVTCYCSKIYYNDYINVKYFVRYNYSHKGNNCNNNNKPANNRSTKTNCIIIIIMMF